MSAFEKIDLHGMTKEQAKTALDSKIKKCKGDVYTLTVVHGYHGGTALRDFVRKQYRNEKIVKKEIGLNDGETEFVLKKLY